MQHDNAPASHLRAYHNSTDPWEQCLAQSVYESGVHVNRKKTAHFPLYSLAQFILRRARLLLAAERCWLAAGGYDRIGSIVVQLLQSGRVAVWPSGPSAGAGFLLLACPIHRPPHVRWIRHGFIDSIPVIPKEKKRKEAGYEEWARQTKKHH